MTCCHGGAFPTSAQQARLHQINAQAILEQAAQAAAREEAVNAEAAASQSARPPKTRSLWWSVFKRYKKEKRTNKPKVPKCVIERVSTLDLDEDEYGYPNICTNNQELSSSEEILKTSKESKHSNEL